MKIVLQQNSIFIEEIIYVSFNGNEPHKLFSYDDLFQSNNSVSV